MTDLEWLADELVESESSPYRMLQALRQVAEDCAQMAEERSRTWPRDSAARHALASLAVDIRKRADLPAI